MNFGQNYFELFQLPVTFSIDLEDLENRYFELHKTSHPDRYVGASDQEKRLAVQWTMQINEAYQNLRDPLARAIYLLKQSGIELADNPQMGATFLVQQIELREKIDSIETHSDGPEQVEALIRSISEQTVELLQQFITAYEAGNMSEAREGVYQMQFMVKLQQSARQMEEKILGY
ncbi:MAG: Fe-S protein assembly co-chaperone HscB [Pseudomonadales bacterium]|nr:Fe-S protein assembly co-chaperone HscB [Pseudomonadales bacterium]